MSAPADILRRVDRLEAVTAPPGPSGIVIYQAGETEEEIRARVPAGMTDAGAVIFLPDNHRDVRPEAP